jgi:uncharacterized spore protein YtfJ
MTQDTERSHVSIERMLDSLNTNAVFGAPVREGEVVVIPVSRVWYGFGEGSGYGRADAPAEGGQGQAGEGGGSGGGGGGSARPLGYIRIAADGVRFEPIVDTGRLALVGMATAAWNIFWIATVLRAFARRR